MQHTHPSIKGNIHSEKKGHELKIYSKIWKSAKESEPTDLFTWLFLHTICVTKQYSCS
jgi:hypothetical protein